MPDEQWRRVLRLGYMMVFGDSAQRRRALSAYDTVSIPSHWAVWSALGAPEDRALVDSVFRRVIERKDVSSSRAAFFLFFSQLQDGQIQQALADRLRTELDENLVGCGLAEALTLGYPVPDSIAAQYLASEHLPDEPSMARLHCAGLYLVETERGDELEDLIERLRATVDTTGPGAVSSGQRQAVIQELRGYRAWKRGQLKRAGELLNRSNESIVTGALWRGDLYRELGRLEKAEGWYLAAWKHPVAHERLGRLYEEMRKPEKAAAAYRRFIAAWEDADPELQPRVEAARKRLEELTASGGEQDE